MWKVVEAHCIWIEKQLKAVYIALVASKDIISAAEVLTLTMYLVAGWMQNWAVTPKDRDSSDTYPSKVGDIFGTKSAWSTSSLSHELLQILGIVQYATEEAPVLIHVSQ